jgi:hypothetical protein
MIGATVMLPISGCVGVVGGSPTHGSGGAPTAGASAGQQELADFAVRLAYEEFWTVVSAHLDEQPPVRWPGILAQVAVEPELSRQLAQARSRSARGVHRYGEVTVHVISVEGAQTTRATLTDCQDASGFGDADSTGRILSAGPTGLPVQASLVRPDTLSPWRVSDLATANGQCADLRIRAPTAA